MNRVITAALCGVLFGAGLALAQMIDPDKVLAFLDLAGAWDPSLILVMGGGAGVTALLFPWVMRRPQPRLDSHFHLPTKRRLDGRLVSGSALFGVGWGWPVTARAPRWWRSRSARPSRGCSSPR